MCNFFPPLSPIPLWIISTPYRTLAPGGMGFGRKINKIKYFFYSSIVGIFFKGVDIDEWSRGMMNNFYRNTKMYDLWSIYVYFQAGKYDFWNLLAMGVSCMHEMYMQKTSICACWEPEFAYPFVKWNGRYLNYVRYLLSEFEGWFYSRNVLLQTINFNEMSNPFRIDLRALGVIRPSIFQIKILIK